MERRTFLKQLGAFGAASLAGCLGNDGHPQFTVSDRIPTIAPSPVDWPLFHGRRNQRLLDGSLPPLSSIEEAPIEPIRNGVLGSVAADDTTYMLTQERVLAVTDDGDIQWNRSYDSFLPDVGVGESGIYIADTGKLVKRSRATGDPTWVVRPPETMTIYGIGHVGSNMVITHAGHQYGDAVVLAFDAANGAVLWWFRTRTNQPSQTPQDSVAVGDSYLLAANASDHDEGLADTGFIYKIRPTERRYDWVRRLEEPIDRIAAAGDTALVQTSVDTRLLDIETGIVQATLTSPRSIVSDAAAMTEEAVFIGVDGALRQYDTTTAEIRWEAEARADRAFQSITTDGQVVLAVVRRGDFTRRSTSLVAYDAQDGKEMAARPLNGIGLSETKIAATDTHLRVASEGPRRSYLLSHDE